MSQSFIDIVTWATVVILGPGALLVFIWFLHDFRAMWKRPVK